MFISDLFENVEPMNTLVVYPGRFQPWHKGHRAVYDYLVGEFGRDRVFIATSNKVDPPRSPFSFSEKLQFMHLTGITSDSVIETRDPYKVPELVGKVDPTRTKLIFAVSQKDMDEDPRFKFGTKKDGTPTYFQPVPKDAYQMQSLDKHGYIMVVPTFNFTVLGQPMTSATQVRAQFAQADDATQQKIIKDLFGRYSPEIHSLMKHKITLNENYDYMPPGANASQTRKVMNKLSTKDNKFIWKKPNQIGGSYTEQELLSSGFKKSKFNSWGGTQSMWNRLLGIKEQLNRPTPSAQEVLKKHNMTPEELVKQLKMGVKVEFEHTKNAKTAYEIALDHLNERPDYYTVLTKSGLEEGAPIVVMPRADRLKKPEPTKVRYQGDIVPPTKPPSTEKRGVKGRPGQRPMPKYEEQGVVEGSGQEPGWFEIYNTRTLERVYHPFEADNIMDAFVKADDWLEAIGKPGRGLSVRPVKETDVAEGSDIPHWRVEQSDATGRYYVVSGYTTKSRRVWKNKLGAVDFNKKADAEAKAQELNKGVVETINSAILNPRFKHKQKIGDYTYTATAEDFEGEPLLWIKAYDGNKEIGHILFEIIVRSPGGRRMPSADYIESGGTEVDPAYRNKGVASTMYAYAKMLGNDIRASYNQTRQGKAMWAAWEKAGDAKHLIGTASESAVAEDAAGVGVIAQNKKMTKDPRYSMSVTKDVQPGQDKKNMQALRLTK